MLRPKVALNRNTSTVILLTFSIVFLDENGRQVPKWPCLALLRPMRTPVLSARSPIGQSLIRCQSR